MPQRVRSLSLAGGMLLLALVLTACATPGTTPGGDVYSPAATPETPTPGAGAPDDFTDRPMLPSCGTVELDQGETIPQESLDCIAEAGTDGAELVVTTPTVEGDPIVTYYRALPDGGIEVFTDMTQDAYGGGWAYDFCSDATGIDESGICADAGSS